MDLGPTLFPIVFAAICGRSMKMIARYLAEKGARLGTLELLNASQSVWGTFESQVLMRHLSFVGANLLFLWALSPLGGQASLRIMKRDLQQSHAITGLRYLSTGPAATARGLALSLTEVGQYADTGALYTAALLAPLSTKTGPQDTWGNVKIPRLEALNDSMTDATGWIPVPANISSPETYSSLVGLPIVGLPSNATSNFTMEANYLSVSCGDFEQFPYPGAKNSTSIGDGTDWVALDKIVPPQIWQDKSSNDPFGQLGRRASFFLDTDRSWAWALSSDAESEALLGRLDGFFGHLNRSRLSGDEEKRERKLYYVSKYAKDPGANRFGLNKAECSVSQNHVEAQIFCDKARCTCVKVRKSMTDTRPTALTGFEHGAILTKFATEFPKAVNFAIGSSPTEHFLVNSSAFPFNQQVGESRLDVQYTNVSVVAPDVFSKRLSLVLNTYYQLSTQPAGYWGSLSSNLSAYGPDTIPVNDIDHYLPNNLSATGHSFFDWYPTFDKDAFDDKSPFVGASTTGNLTSVEEVFVCNFAWVALLFSASTVLLVTGVAALVMKRLTLGPEVFGFVTSMTYENPFVKVPEGGSTLDAMERARIMRDVEVYVADVAGEKDLGHVAFAAGVPLRKLERSRTYA
ncbi:hypothetical protein SLS60_000310 [Paraconiothyrium brasiliense]|uniref:Uncharacterized protein n=1 Tax=Paraconiothyrium brasiliense TaxID=300254 RepID=A0ABR3S7B8_9PLEO